MHTLKDVSRMHAGVIAAIMHVFAVREPGVVSLARQFAAARRVVVERANAGRLPPPLHAAFADGLSVTSLKMQLRRHAVGTTCLNALSGRRLRGVVIERDVYRDLVVAAAEAALNAPLEEDFYRSRRRSRWEARALEEIRNVFDEAEWQTGNRRCQAAPSHLSSRY